MKHLIDKDALVAEIKARISDIEVSQKAGLIKKRDANMKITLFKSILSLLDTIEVKWVDLNEETDNYWETLTSDVRDSIYFNDFYKIAKHFFELGLKAQKGEKV